ncbi:terminase large subunit domain-containing protein [Luteimonas saliphila]|uniref:terminase large subunit domain-containing protein n=1 Tax=Luteimonas saliphila TaxID=2804919 RepID=UPI00192E2ADD|nr:terminase family protein [Luteimonas saliphila]
METANPPVVWTPSEKQTQFLTCPDWEVLYGGAAGGGKSDAMLIDAWCLQHNGASNPNHRAVIFRKSFTDLRDLIDRANDLFPRFIRKIRYNKTEHIFTTPAGAKLELAYLENEADRFKYRGRNWNYLGWEELTLWPSDVPYVYLMTRCRTVDRTLPKYIRATTNPDGPGQSWVMQRWGIDEEGGPTVQAFQREFEELAEDGSIVKVMRTVRRRFIPARLSDNPHLAGTGYREQFAELPPDDRDALLLGRWIGNRVRGAWYQKEMAKLRQEGRLTNVPHMGGTTVNTFWDLGFNDTTSIVFHQFAALQNRFLHAYENSGESLAHYAAYLLQMSQERGYVYGTHYLPHDAENKSLQTGKSALDALRKLLPGHRFVVVKRTEQLKTGIDQTRAAFASAWIDSDECIGLVAALDAYRKKWDPKQEVFLDNSHVHDRYSNYADAFRQWGQGFVMPANSGSGKRRASGSDNWKTA